MELHGVMPGMKAGRVEDPPQWTEVPPQVRMAKFLDEQGKRQNGEDHLVSHAEDHERQIDDGFVDHDLAPVRSESRRPIELFDTMVQLVEFPQPRHEMQPAVDIPLQK